MKHILKQAGRARDYLMFTLLFNTGLRISDVLALRTRDVMDYKGKYKHISLIEKKTQKRNKHHLNSAIVEAFNYYYEAFPHRNTRDMYLIFSTKAPNKPITTTAAWKIIKKLGELAGVTENIGTHSGRKSWMWHFVKQQQEQGNGLEALFIAQKKLNHSDPRITSKYLMLDDETMERATQQVVF